ncbi:hypothetical protein ACOL3F_05860 [Aliarcobacter butzleri]
MNFEIYFEKLFNFYNVSTIKELSEKIKIGASTISAWNQRKSITALKKACREIGIYNEIFGDLNSNIQMNNGVSGGQIAQNQNIKGNLNINHQIINDIDNSTLSLFKEAYQKAKSSDDIKGFRIYLMDYK